jgi:hypothetical protein
MLALLKKESQEGKGKGNLTKTIIQKHRPKQPQPQEQSNLGVSCLRMLPLLLIEDKSTWLSGF